LRITGEKFRKELEKRLKQHNTGQMKYTKGRRPWKVHYIEEFSTKSEAYKREQYFKSIQGYRFLKSQGII
jgi:putative endonuclease